MSFYVYVHTNKINGKKYVGVTIQKPQRRWGRNGVNYKCHPYFYSAIQKYGWENFDHQVFEVDTKSEMYYLEQYLISYYETYTGKGYNLSRGGESGNYKGIGPDGYKEHSKEYMKDHKEEIKEYQRQWYLKNQERIKAKSTAYRIEHKEEMKDYFLNYQRKWRAENIDKLRAQQQRHRLNRKLRKINQEAI